MYLEDTRYDRHAYRMTEKYVTGSHHHSKKQGRPGGSAGFTSKANQGLSQANNILVAEAGPPALYVSCTRGLFYIPDHLRIVY
ncbi:hypothetical protein EYR41_004519 [Orbilia oligospora]|uniref:Uncharacterized protein n=1 Tax=Orbilia oligospora TaxID=2813651 RepID=A0A7C8KEV6_ORBOL|nr:hypothetical protein TWF751_005352 [Orbilia oligospora]KAF3295085.1 hypothetical protein TWF132_002409 [Orbilia oligospora]TGJ72643.1 hypothetical protein EYR41_004519 [Orbilia oligospora]